MWASHNVGVKQSRECPALGLSTIGWKSFGPLGWDSLRTVQPATGTYSGNHLESCACGHPRDGQDPGGGDREGTPHPDPELSSSSCVRASQEAPGSHIRTSHHKPQVEVGSLSCALEKESHDLRASRHGQTREAFLLGCYCCHCSDTKIFWSGMVMNNCNPSSGEAEAGG